MESYRKQSDIELLKLLKLKDDPRWEIKTEKDNLYSGKFKFKIIVNLINKKPTESNLSIDALNGVTIKEIRPTSGRIVGNNNVKMFDTDGWLEIIGNFDYKG